MSSRARRELRPRRDGRMLEVMNPSRLDMSTVDLARGKRRRFALLRRVMLIASAWGAVASAEDAVGAGETPAKAPEAPRRKIKKKLRADLAEEQAPFVADLPMPSVTEASPGVRAFNLLRWGAQQSQHRAGDEVIIDIFYDDDALTLEAAWHQLDSRPGGPITIVNYRHGRYRVRYRLSRDFVPPSGKRALSIMARNARGVTYVDSIDLGWNSPSINPLRLQGANLVRGSETLGRVALKQADGPRVTRLLVEPSRDNFWKVSLAWEGDADGLFLWALGCQDTLHVQLDEASRQAHAAQLTVEFPWPTEPLRIDIAAARERTSAGWENTQLPGL